MNNRPSFLALVFKAALAMFVLPAGIACATTSGIEAGPTPEMTAQVDRVKYQQALDALDEGKLPLFEQLQSELVYYSLYPYLKYQYLTRNLKSLPDREAKNFLEQYPDTPLAPRLKHSWLRTLAKQGEWSRYLDNFDSKIRSTELICYALWAQHKTGRSVESLSTVKDLWLVGHSQPNACDPIFKHWSEQGNMDDELLWQRFSLAMRNGKTQLARYLIRYMSKEKQSTAKLYRDIYFRPARLSQRSQFLDLTPDKESILIHGLERLARRDAQLAQELWDQYNREHEFSQLQHQKIARHIILGHARQGNDAQYQLEFESYSFPHEVVLIEAGIKLAIGQQQWPRVIDRINLLPASSRQLNHWQYWFARAQQSTSTSDIGSIKILEALAVKRDYYGFLAADYLDLPYQTNQQSYPVDGNFYQQFKRLPGIIRSRELYMLGNHLDARREWQRATVDFSNDQHYAAAQYAFEFNWHSQAIKSAIDAERWHDLKLRFPLAFESEFMTAAKIQGIDENWILAVARQESAMMPDAKSGKGARGLMQLMPGTAKEVARKHNLPLRNRNELTNPDINIKIGSTYLRSLFNEFEGNSIYATAAYNAGPHRVKKWLHNAKHLPLDIWVEQIPYAETRQYVKNVLAYSVIFALKRSDTKFRMATAPYLADLSSAIAATTPATDTKVVQN